MTLLFALKCDFSPACKNTRWVCVPRKIWLFCVTFRDSTTENILGFTFHLRDYNKSNNNTNHKYCDYDLSYTYIKFTYLHPRSPFISFIYLSIATGNVRFLFCGSNHCNKLGCLRVAGIVHLFACHSWHMLYWISTARIWTCSCSRHLRSALSSFWRGTSNSALAH